MIDASLMSTSRKPDWSSLSFSERFYIYAKYASMCLTTFCSKTREIPGDQIRGDRGPHVPRGRLPSEQFVA